jgi:hypothetical protein
VRGRPAPQRGDENLLDVVLLTKALRVLTVGPDLSQVRHARCFPRFGTVPPVATLNGRAGRLGIHPWGMRCHRSTGAMIDAVQSSSKGAMMGCLLAIFAGVFPRLGLFIIWIARPALVNAAFDTWILPLLGIIFFPFATLIYVVLYTPGVGLTGWGWFWVAFAALLDVGHWGVSATQRRQIPGYPAG